MWGKNRREAIISRVEDIDYTDFTYKAKNQEWYERAIRFRDEEQYNKILFYNDAGKTKYQKSKPKKASLTAKLDKVFSEYIRLRDTREDGTFTCISCNRILPYDQADCGHYINRKHMSTRFSEKNCNAQCRSCNRFDEGNIQGYRRGLVAKYGEYAVVMLESMKNQINKISEFEYNTMIDHYRKEVKRLKREKGI